MTMVPEQHPISPGERSAVATARALARRGIEVAEPCDRQGRHVHGAQGLDPRFS